MSWLRLTASSFLTSVLLVGSVSAQGTQNPFAQVVEQLVSLFPRVEGEVIEAQGDAVTIALGRRDGLQKGIELQLFRQGRELRHPRTGQLLGRTESALGRVVVEESFEAYSIGRASPGAGAQPGDRVRITSARLRVVVAPVIEGMRPSLVEAALHELVSGLAQSGRFQPIREEQIGARLAEERLGPQALQTGEGLAPLIHRVKADYLLVVRLTQPQGKPHMELKLFSAAGAGPLISTAMAVPSTVRPLQAGFSSGARPGPAEPRPSQRSLLARLLLGDGAPDAYSAGAPSVPLREAARFPFPVRLMDVAVSPHDKIPRIVVNDGFKVHLYRVVEGVIEPEWTHTVRSFGMVFSLQLGDLDGDGQLEVLLNRYYPPLGVISTIISSKGGRPVPMAEEINDLILWAVDESGTGVKDVLWGQKFDRERFFGPGVERYAVRSGKLVSLGRVPLPESFRATGAAFSSVNGKNTPRVLAYVDEHQRLRIVSGGEELWRSSTAVGGRHIDLQIERGPQGARPMPDRFVKLEPTPLAVDLDGDGVEELVVSQNDAPGLMAVVFKGPAGFRLQSVNSGFEGVITAVGAFPGPPGTSPTLLAAVVRFSNFLKTSGETQVIMTVPE